MLLVDFNQERGEAAAQELNCKFAKADISNYDHQAQAFQIAWKEYGRIDFGTNGNCIPRWPCLFNMLMDLTVFANAGITDTIDFYATNNQTPPPQLSMAAVQVNLVGTIYTSYLAMHYLRRTTSGTAKTLICTSSGAGLYASDPIPVYSASKHGIVGLVRSLARRFEMENIMVHAVLPGAVPTNIVDPDSMKDFPKEWFTSVQNIVDCVEALLFRKGQFMNSKSGRIVEVSRENMYHRDQPLFCDEVMAKIMGELGDTEEIKSTTTKSSKI